MTDKQIIIDEIDISKCDFCDSGEYCHIYSGTADFRWMCKENEDCQIKKLLLKLKQAENQIVELNKMVEAKEQECEALKKATITLAEGLNFRQQLVEKLKQTLEEIKSLCYEQDLNEDFFACEILQKISECEVERWK